MTNSNILDIENRLDTQKMVDDTARKDAFDYLVDSVHGGCQVSLQELVYVLSVLDYIKSNTSEELFKTDYIVAWAPLMSVLQKTLDEIITITATDTPIVKKVFDDLRDWISRLY